MIYRPVLLFLLCQTLTRLRMSNGNVDSITTRIAEVDTKSLCNRTHDLILMEFICPNEPAIPHLDLDDIQTSQLESIQFFRFKGSNNDKGPLTIIPSNICRFTKLKNLDLTSNQIQNISLHFTTSCLSELQTLHLGNNSISEIPIYWFHQMPLLEYVYLWSNKIANLPYYAFNNISRLRVLNVAQNNLSTIELWTIQVQNTVDYQSNPINRFSNVYNVDLSHIQSRNIPKIYTAGNPQIKFDDTIFAMYNRCAEVHNIPNFSKTYAPTLTLAILSIVNSINSTLPFYWKCDCDQYYFYRAAFEAKENRSNDLFSNWTCPGDSRPFVQKCNNRSSANFSNVVPRLCKIDNSETGLVPVYDTSFATTTTTTSTTTTQSTTKTTPVPPHPEIIANETEKELNKIPWLYNSTAKNFTDTINNASSSLNTIVGRNVTEEVQKTYQNIISQVETLIKSVNSTLNISDAEVAVFSGTKDNSINHLTQYILSNSSIIYSSIRDDDNSTASISIDRTYIDQLSNDSIYSLFFLPSSLFQYAQIDHHIEIVSPIVGANFPDEQNLIVEMSFHDTHENSSSGTYSCVFWQNGRWNNSGCDHSIDAHTNRHYCHCNHLKSFALIFTPNGILRETFLPSIIAAGLSMIGLCISILLSVYEQTGQQATPRSRHLPIVNIFSLFNTLILFILLTAILIINYQSSRIPSSTQILCHSSRINLILTTYFFIILTFASKTFLGICHYYTLFVDVELDQLSDKPKRLVFTVLVILVIIALIPTIAISVLAHQQGDVFVQYDNVCWFHRIYLIYFITIPVSIFISINIMIIVLIGIQLLRNVFCSTSDQAKEKRLMAAACIWIASCIPLGVVWIVGPLLGLFVDDDDRSTTMVAQRMQWVFAILIGLEGVWILIVNVLFYLRQRPKIQRRWAYSPTGRSRWWRIDDFGKVGIDTDNNQENENHVCYDVE